MPITLENIKVNRKKIREELNDNAMDRKEGNDMLTHLEILENIVKNDNSNSNSNSNVNNSIKKIIHNLNKKGKGMGGGGGGMEGGHANRIINYIENINLFKNIVNTYVSNGLVSNILLTFINTISNKIINLKAIDIDQFNEMFNKHGHEYLVDIDITTQCAHYMFKKMPLQHLTDSQVISMYENMGPLNIENHQKIFERMAIIICNRENSIKLTEIMNKIFESDEGKHILAYLMNHYTSVIVVFGVGVIGYRNASQIFTKIRNVIVNSFNKSKQLLFKQKNIVDINPNPIIIVPSDIVENDVKIEL